MTARPTQSETTSNYRLMGLEASPYTMKVDAYLKYKGLPYEWVIRNLKNEKLFQTHAKVQLIPLLFFPSGETMQDSTLIIERLEREEDGPSIHPDDKALWFLSCLFEEFGDEWCNKLMFFQRWFYETDAKATGKRLARDRLQGQWWGALARPLVAHLVVRRMVPRLVYSGGNETNIPQLKQSFIDLCAMLDQHFLARPYLLGGRPCFGDFGLWCNLYEAWTDPTAKAYIEANSPALTAYIKRMLSPSADGEFETLDTLTPTLRPILQQEMATRFLPWMEANHQAFHAGEAETRLTMNGELFKQKTFKYQARTLDELRRKFSTVAEHAPLTGLLRDTGCLGFMQAKENA
ncbi:glutathione S-transferase family protein [Maricaulis sp.]|uniref:glutathione S-transferase N-terminal domain-containing protein n=1 Tax=Maricaulis sp. TaxID=1486257 RepID=UPI002604F141|nr:glutathione S-transferase family protein [Maricaulis sp.]